MRVNPLEPGFYDMFTGGVETISILDSGLSAIQKIDNAMR